MSDTDWYDIIREQGNARRRQEDEMAKNMEEQLPAFLKSISTFSDKELIARLLHHSRLNSVYERRRVKAMHRLCAIHIRKEILRRMAYCGPLGRLVG